MTIYVPGINEALLIPSGDTSGVTDANIINNALITASAAGGGIINLGPGIFTVTGITATSLSNLRLSGAGRNITTIRLNANNTNDVIRFTTCTDISIDNLTVDCNRVAQTQGTNEDLQNGIHFISTNQISVHNVKVLNSFMSGIRFGTFAAGSGTCTDGTVSQCYVNAGGSNGDQGIGIWNSVRITVTGCNINQGGWGGIVLTYSDYCTITGNTSYNNQYTIGGPTNGGHGIALEGARWCTVVGNVCYGNNVHGIHMENDPMTSARNCLDCTVEGNTCQNQIEGIFIGHASRCTITGNTINTSSQYGLELSQNADTCVVQGNLVETSTFIGFWIKASGSAVVGNTARSNTQQGFLMQQSVTNVNFSNNVATGNTGAGFDIRGTTNCIVVGNVATANGNQGFIVQDDGAVHNNNGVLNNNQANGNTNEGILLLNTNGFSITGNFCSGNLASGLDLRGCTFCTVSSNTCMNQGTTGSNQPGIRLENNGTNFCLHNTVCNNISSDNQGTHTQSRGIEELGSSNSNIYTNNICVNNVAGQISVVGASDVNVNNIIV